jgi:hypothetical protein
MEEISKDEQVCHQDRGHIVELINMSLKQLWDLAYQAGYEDGMSFIETPSKEQTW